MEFFPLVDGKRLPEVYHFGFNGTHFVIFMKLVYWRQFVELTKQGTYYASNQGKDYVPPVISGGTFGQHGTANASETPDGFMCIRVPAYIENSDDENQVVTMRTLGHTLASILFLTHHLLYEIEKQKEEALPQVIPQLFVVETYVAYEPGQPHGAGLDFSLSYLARKYLEDLGNNILLDEAIKLMEDHYQRPSRRHVKLYRGSIDVHVRSNGVLHMHTIGQCACLGAMPKDFGGRGCHLSSHNVDTVFQQFNLLVGIAYIWQMVRDGIRMEQHTS